MGNTLDHLAKGLASGMPRRKLFKLVAGGVAASIGATVLDAAKPIIGRAAPYHPTAIAVSPASGIYGDAVDLSANLTWINFVGVNQGIAEPHPLVNQQLTFMVPGNHGGSQITDNTGTAVLQNVSLSGINEGDYSQGVVVNYAGIPEVYMPSLNYGPLTVLAAPTSVVADPASGPAGGTTDLSATLSMNYVGLNQTIHDAPIFNRVLSFWLNGHPVGSAVTAVNGVASLFNVSLNGFAPGVYPEGVMVNFARQRNYLGSVDTAPLSVSLGILVLFDQEAAIRRGLWVWIKIAVTDGQGHNLSARSLPVNAVSLQYEDGPAQPFTRPFQFSSSVTRGGGYQLLINTRTLEPGTYTLGFQVDGDPTLHSVQFVVR